jgi:hypothetical protein
MNIGAANMNAHDAQRFRVARCETCAADIRVFTTPRNGKYGTSEAIVALGLLGALRHR